MSVKTQYPFDAKLIIFHHHRQRSCCCWCWYYYYKNYYCCCYQQAINLNHLWCVYSVFFYNCSHCRRPRCFFFFCFFLASVLIRVALRCARLLSGQTCVWAYETPSIGKMILGFISVYVLMQCPWYYDGFVNRLYCKLPLPMIIVLFLKVTSAMKSTHCRNIYS